MNYGWKPNKEKAKEYVYKMKEIEVFCLKHGIEPSSTYDSYYFQVNGQNYRVSNRAVDSISQKHLAFGEFNNLRNVDPDCIYIHAGKTRIMEIYNDLVAGYDLDGRGNRK